MIKIKLKSNFFFQISTIASFLFFSDSITAQVIPDNTLPNNSQVTVDENTFVIEEGTRRGSNLFHSFEQFSLLTGKEAIFNNNLFDHNIFSRVTGNSPSTIDGFLRANGSANLFLINPNGIIFGTNAQLDIGGSFLGSTANSIIFADGFEFNAINLSKNSLLTISMPVGLNFSENPGKIIVQGIGHSLKDSPFVPFTGRNPSVSFQVKPTQTLALIGGDLVLTGGLLTSEGGKIELGSVDNGFVRLDFNSNWSFDYENVSNFRDIILSSKTLVDVSGTGNGSVHLQGANISLNDGSVILNQTFGSQSNGILSVDASKTLKIEGLVFDGSLGTRSGLNSETLGSGRSANISISVPQLVLEDGAIGTSSYSSARGGDINISTQKLTVADGGVIGTATAAVLDEGGRGGNINISASENIQVSGESSITPGALSAIASNTRGNGDGGNIIIFTPFLRITARGLIGTNALGTGNGGNVILNVSNSIELIGGSGFDTASSLASATFGLGDAGQLTLNTSKLLVQDGAAITASTFFNGEAGGIAINASDFIEVDGGIISSSASFAPESLRRLFSLPLELKGFSGNISINTSNLKLINGGLITVRNDGVGNAGILNLNAESIVLDRSAITATTQSGEGGNININSQDIRLFDDSQISATAGGTGSGGNITIDTNSLLVLNESSINANAFEGKGGNINITSQTLFTSSDSSITASSQFGVSGEVELNIANSFQTNPAETGLPSNFPRLENLSTQVCSASNTRRNRFTVRGRENIGTTSGNNIDSYTLEDLIPLGQAVGIKKDENGRIYLTGCNNTSSESNS